MKQKIILCVTFIALSFGASAQYSRSVITKSDAGAVSEVIEEANKQTAIELETKALKKQQLKDTYDYWKHIVMLNANLAIGDMESNAYGFTYAYVKKAGFYVSFETNFGPTNREIATPNYFYTGVGRCSRYSVLAGGMVCLGIPLYLHAGLGYAFYGEYLQTTDKEWVCCDGPDEFAYEVGLLAHYKNIALSLTFSGVTDYHFGFKVGVGYCF
jgi:hypothetical protein